MQNGTENYKKINLQNLTMQLTTDITFLKTVIDFYRSIFI